MKMSKKFERVFSVLIAFVLAFGIVANTANLEAYAAGKNYGKFSTLDSITEDITLFRIIKSGTISAVYDSGWYYKFSNSSGSVMIKVSAFTSSPKNTNLTVDNDAFNSVVGKVNGWKTSYSRICYYYKRTTSNTTSSGTTYKSYKTTMYRFQLKFIGTNDEIDMKTTLTDGVTFTYNAKVPVTTKYQQKCSNGKTITSYKTTYQTPSNATQYVNALKRSTSVDAITPIMEVALDNGSVGDMFLSKYSVSGCGNANTKTSISSILNVVTATASATKNAVYTLALPTPSGVYSTLTSLYSAASAIKLVYNKSSKEYNTGDSEELTYTRNNKTYYIVKAMLTSPIKLSNTSTDDWVKYTFNTSNISDKSNTTGVSLKIQFAFDTTKFCPVSLT